MEYFKFFLNVFDKEVKKSNLNWKKIVAYNSELNRVDGIFEIPYNRCAFIYKYATTTFCFIKDCVTSFLDEYSDIKNLILMWNSSLDLKMCSFSCGPGLDYLAFMVALSEFNELDMIPLFKGVNIVSKSAQWKNTLNSVIESIIYLEHFPISKLCENFNVVYDPFQKFSGKHNNAIKNSHVFFMVKTLNLQSLDAVQELKTYFKEVVNAMSTNSILFCIDTKPSVKLMAEVLYDSPGEYIYGPFLNNTFRLLENFPEEYKDTFGCLPIMSTRGAFFVWKKLPFDSCRVNVYPSVMTENPFKNGEIKDKIDNVSSNIEINTTTSNVYPVKNQSLGTNVINSCKQEDVCSSNISDLKIYADLLSNPSYELINVGKNCINIESVINGTHSCNELSSLLNRYYNLDKNSCLSNEQLEGALQNHSQDFTNEIIKVPQEKPVDGIEYDVSILLSNVCDVVHQAHNSNTMHLLKNESNLSEPTICEQQDFNTYSNNNSNIAMLDDQSQGKYTESVVTENFKPTVDSFSDISEASFKIAETKSAKKRRRQKAKSIKQSTLMANASKSSTNSSTPIKKNSEQIKNIKFINTSNFQNNTSNSQEIDTKLKIPLSNKMNGDSVVNVVSNQSVTKRSVNCGTNSVNENTNSESIESLTKRIKNLVASFETILTQNQQLHHGNKNMCSSNSNCMSNSKVKSPLTNNDSSVDDKSESQGSFQCLHSGIPIENSHQKKSFQNNDINNEEINPEIKHSHCDRNTSSGQFCEMHCCRNMCCKIQTCCTQMHKCASACSFHNCHHCVNQRVLPCTHSHDMHGSQNPINPNVPNLVIPLQNISDDVIAQIILSLRGKS